VDDPNASFASCKRFAKEPTQGSARFFAGEAVQVELSANRPAAAPHLGEYPSRYAWTQKLGCTVVF
jgi:hypothetical protein